MTLMFTPFNRLLSNRGAPSAAARAPSAAAGAPSAAAGAPSAAAAFLADGTAASGRTRPIHLPGLWIRPDGARLGTLCLIPERNGMSVRLTSALPPPVTRPEPRAAEPPIAEPPIAEPAYDSGPDYSDAPGTEHPFMRDPFETPTEQEIDSLSIREVIRKQGQ